MGSAGETP
ncbi:hypothetical protein YPPY55_4552, partial [Yersinia pestis PY-55]